MVMLKDSTIDEILVFLESCESRFEILMYFGNYKRQCTFKPSSLTYTILGKGNCYPLCKLTKIVTVIQYM